MTLESFCALQAARIKATSCSGGHYVYRETQDSLWPLVDTLEPMAGLWDVQRLAQEFYPATVVARRQQLKRSWWRHMRVDNRPPLGIE